LVIQLSSWPGFGTPSTEMNLMSELAFAASPSASPSRNPTPITTSAPLSVNWAMFAAYSDWLVVSMYSVSKQLGAASAAAIMPSYADWLKPLSLTRPTSVTRPTESGASQVMPSGAAEGSTDGSTDASTDGGGATEASADGAVVAPPPLHAATKMARPANRVKP
jgi:hypothetical protein